MRIGLFIPCYVDQFYPSAGIATLKILEKLGYDVSFPLNQTCCGQPMANAGFAAYTHEVTELFIKNFAGFDYIVSPSGSCVLHTKEHLSHHAENYNIPLKIYELCEFLIDIAQLERLQASFPFKVGLHAGCHGLRGLRLANASELNESLYNKPKYLLQKVKGLELVELARPDECCGFGGTFSVTEEAVSVSMGNDRIEDHLSHGAEVITSTDMSCLMHLEGLIRRQKKNVRIMHIAEILNANESR